MIWSNRCRILSGLCRFALIRQLDNHFLALLQEVIAWSSGWTKVRHPFPPLERYTGLPRVLEPRRHRTIPHLSRHLPLCTLPVLFGQQIVSPQTTEFVASRTSWLAIVGSNWRLEIIIQLTRHGHGQYANEEN